MPRNSVIGVKTPETTRTNSRRALRFTRQATPVPGDPGGCQDRCSQGNALVRIVLKVELVRFVTNSLESSRFLLSSLVLCR